MKRCVRGLAILLAALVMLMFRPGSASAAGYTGPNVAGGCGWLDQQSYTTDYKYAFAVWPSVAAVNTRSGVVDHQYVYAQFQWYERKPYATTLQAAGSPEWRWAYASDAQYTKDWRTFGTNVNQVVMRFAGSTLSDSSTYPDVYLYISLYWYTGSTVTGTVGYWASNAGNVINPWVCNGGASLGFY